MDVKGLLIGLRKFSFTDKDSGELIQGAKLILGVTPDHNDAVGYVVQEIPTPYETFSNLSKTARDHIGQLVQVSCEIKLSGRYTKLSALAVTAI